MLWELVLKLEAEVGQACLRVTYQAQCEISLKIIDLTQEDCQAQDQRAKDSMPSLQKIIIDLKYNSIEEINVYIRWNYRNKKRLN